MALVLAHYWILAPVFVLFGVRMIVASTNMWPDETVELLDLSVVAEKTLVHDADVELVGEIVMAAVRAASKSGKIVPLYGVIPAPLKAWLMKWDENNTEDFWSFTLQIYEAWNIQRTSEGGRATFEHKRWVLTAEISRFPDRKF